MQAKLPLRVFLIVANSMAGQNSVYTWSRDHRWAGGRGRRGGERGRRRRGLVRVRGGEGSTTPCRLHHKASETQGDPHNANRGFFFAHMGWLCVR